MQNLGDRTKYIGGSDCAGILGMSRWKTPLQVWAEKTGQVPEKDISQQTNVKLGIALEDTVAQFFTEETGKKLRRVNKTLVHPKYDFIRANIDRDVVGEDAIMECKTAAAWKGKEWGGTDIPQEYLLQCYHYLAVTGASKCYIAVLIGNQDFKWKEIPRDEKVIEAIIAKEVAFWNDFVLTKQMPANIKAADGDVLFHLFPSETDDTIEIGDEVDRLADSIEALESDSRVINDQIDTSKNKLKALLQTHSKGLGRRWRVTWKVQFKKSVDTKALEKKHPAIYTELLKETSFKVLRTAKLNDEE